MGKVVFHPNYKGKSSKRAKRLYYIPGWKYNLFRVSILVNGLMFLYLLTTLYRG